MPFFFLMAQKKEGKETGRSVLCNWNWGTNIQKEAACVLFLSHFLSTGKATAENCSAALEAIFCFFRS